jgi:Na+/H+ antiporter NhaD/arsenite permease-like protein
MPETDTAVLAVFAAVYATMILGGIPGLAIDRTGAALLGAILLMALGKIHIRQLGEAVDAPTLALLLGLMVVSSQFRLAGFYSWLVRRLAAVNASPPMLLVLVILLTGALSAVLANDIVCLAVTPVLIEGCWRRNLNPKPYLLGLACAANVGSAATLIGNPQNMLIGEVLELSFRRYLALAWAPSLLGLLVTAAVIILLHRGRWRQPGESLAVQAPPFNRWQAGKGLVVTGGLMLAFMFAPWPRDLVALAAAAILLCSRRMHSREMLGLVDYQLLILFVSLFVLNHTMQTSGNLAWLMDEAARAGIPARHPGWLFGLSVALSNLVSNVPATMLLLPSATHPLGGPILALSSTLAGNLFVVGSIANIIVIDQAARLQVRITWREHARVGVPVTLLTLALAAISLWLHHAG